MMGRGGGYSCKARISYEVFPDMSGFGGFRGIRTRLRAPGKGD